MYIIYTYFIPRHKCYYILPIQFHKRSCLTLKAVFVVVAASDVSDFRGFLSSPQRANQKLKSVCVWRWGVGWSGDGGKGKWGGGGVGGGGGHHHSCLSAALAVARYYGDLLTPSLSWCHLKTTNKSAEFETLNCFCLLFRTGVWKDFHRNTQHWK